MLYIQMQLCKHSLKDWISERNMKPKEETTSTCKEDIFFVTCQENHKAVHPEVKKYDTFSCVGPYECVDSEQTLKLLKQIVEGVEYIHSRGIMHRDLKVSPISR